MTAGAAEKYVISKTFILLPDVKQKKYKYTKDTVIFHNIFVIICLGVIGYITSVHYYRVKRNINDKSESR